MHDTDKYSMTPDQYEALMQKEQQRETQEREDKQARENLKKLEKEVDDSRYQQLVEMVQGTKSKHDGPSDAEKKKAEEEKAKK